MNCDGVSNLLSAYVDGELSPGELLRVEEHLRRCHACADEVDSLRQTIALVASLEEVEVPASFQVQLHERLVALGPPVAAVRRAPAAPVWQRNVRRWAMPAAAAAAALAIGLTTYSGGGKIPTPGLLAQSDFKVPAEKLGAVNNEPDTGKTTTQLPPTAGSKDNTQVNPKPDNGTGSSTDTDNRPAPDTGTPAGGGPVITVTQDPKAPTTPEQTNLYVQRKVVITGIVTDADKQNQINSHFLVRVPTQKGIDLKVPVAELSNAVDFVKATYPGVQVTVSDLDLTAEMQLVEQSLQAVRAEIAQMTNAPRAEKEAQLAELQRREQELQASLENYRALLTSATISLEYVTATPR